MNTWAMSVTWVVKILLWGINDLYIGVNIILLFAIQGCAVILLLRNRRDWRGWLLIGLFTLNLVRMAIGAEYDQQHPEYRPSFQHNSAIYNFVKRHNTLRCTPAMAAGVAKTFWSVGELLEAAA